MQVEKRDRQEARKEVFDMPKVTGLSHVVLYVDDLEKMVNFYREVLGLVVTHEHTGRMVFMTADPNTEDHMLALTKGREGGGKIIAHMAWHVEDAAAVKAAYDQFKATGIPIDHTVSHAYYAKVENTVSCYFLDPEGNRLEVFATVAEEDPEHRSNRPIDLDQDLEGIIAQASGRVPAAAH
jgi:catechol 2,3-dioxygenase-like lactoylglutathione lyase family enzyme